MSFITNNLLGIFDVEALIRYGGLFLVCIIVFGTTGFFFCFFIPTGAFTFTAGVYTATGNIPYNIYIVCSLLIIASVLGNITAYWFGKKAGPLLYKREDSRFFKKQHLTTATSFYEKYGWLALTMGLFLPVIRTFSPIVAGIIKLEFRRFLLLTFLGSVLWILSFTLAGYAIGKIPALKPWLNYIVIGFIIIVTIPLIIWVRKELKRLQKVNKENVNN
ncbi:MAG: VTT domain-containing protein [Chitinophagaceae bacterium]